MRNPNTIPPDQRSEVIATIQRILWIDDDGEIDPDKACGADEIGEIVNALTAFGLGPE